jgi:hypothetical protein
MRAHLFLLKPNLDGGRFGREHSEPWSEREGWYVHAATLDIEPHDEVDDVLQAVWTRTQHGRDDWTGGTSARWVSGPGLRSSYVGDVVVLEGSPGVAPGGRAVYEIALAGFRRIDVPADQITPARTVPPSPGEVE